MNTAITGDLPEIRTINRSTLEKRVRRALATKGYRLLKSRPGTPEFREYGRYAVENGLRRVIAINHDLSLLAHELGVMGAREALKPRYTRISIATFRHEDDDTDRMEHVVIGKPGAGRLLFDILAGPFNDLALAEEAREMIQGGRDHE